MKRRKCHKHSLPFKKTLDAAVSFCGLESHKIGVSDSSSMLVE
jgi:hypothetical protein